MLRKVGVRALGLYHHSDASVPPIQYAIALLRQWASVQTNKAAALRCASTINRENACKHLTKRGEKCSETRPHRVSRNEALARD